MKTMKNKLPVDGCRLPVEKPEGFRRLPQIENRKSKIVSGFTLIELLVVISIIGILAAFTVPVLSRVERHQYISQTQAEMGQLQAAIESYHATYGFYPPSNPNYPATPNQAMFSPLYFELLGTTINSTNGTYQTLDSSASISTVTVTVQNGLGVGGFINCTKPGSAEDAPAAKNFLPGLKPNQFGINITNGFNSANIPVTLLLGSVGGPDSTYQPLNASGLNPWRYVSPGVNNPNSYDLWIQLVIGGNTNLICNWSKEVQINNPLP